MNDDEINRVLSYGCHGNDVKSIQELLGTEESGIYDLATKRAIEEYQIKSNLSVTGEIGPDDENHFIHYCLGSCTDESLDALEDDESKKIKK